jgi:hypothetical protein
VGSHWPWLIAGAMSVSASTALVPRLQPGPAAPTPVAAARPAEAPADPVGGGRWLAGSEHALELLGDHLGVDGAYRERVRAERALATHLHAPHLTALDLSKDAAAQKHRDALLRRLETEDYDRWLLESVRQRARDKRVRVQFVIAMMPDYVDSNSAWMFDSYLDAVQRAAGSAGLVLDRFHLPDWAPEKGLESGVADRRAHEEEPGMVLFRNTRPPEESRDDVDLLMVLIPTETATLGVHPAAFLSAAALASSFAPSEPLLVLGPSFSGSTPSLVRALNETKRQGLLKEHDSFPTVRILAGSATARSNQDRLQRTELETLSQTALNAHPECGEVQFSSTSVSDKDYLIALRDYLGRIDEDWRFGNRMALLIEGNTGWGQTMLDGLGRRKALERASEQPLVQHDCRAGRRVFPCAQLLTFPLHISRLRGAAAARGRSPASVDPLSSAVSLELEERVPPSDQIPALTPGITAATVETTLASIMGSLDRLHVSAVGIYATDKRDHLFLAQEITRRAPNVLLFALDSNLIYLHPDFRPYLRGTLVASPNPLFNLTQLLAGRPDAHRLLQFPNTGAANVYNAFLALLGRPDKMLDYGAGCGPDASLALCAPSVWLGVVGQEDIWPLERARLLPSVNQGYSWPGSRGALYHAAAPTKAVPAVRVEWPQPTLLLLVGLALALLLHAGMAAIALSTFAGRAWLRRLLPILEPPHHRARRLRHVVGSSGSLEGPRDAVLRQEEADGNGPAVGVAADPAQHPVVGLQLAGQAERDDAHVELGHGVGDVRREPLRVHVERRRQHENVRVGALLEVRNAGLGDQKSAARIDAVHQIVALHVRGDGVRERDGAGIVDADIEAAEGLHRLLDRRLHLLLEADIAGDGQRLAAGRFDLLGGGEDGAFELGMRLGGLGGDGNVGAVARGPERDGQADAPAGAGNKQRLALECRHGSCLVGCLAQLAAAARRPVSQRHQRTGVMATS